MRSMKRSSSRDDNFKVAGRPDGTRGFGLERTSSAQLYWSLLKADAAREAARATSPLTLGRAFSAPAASERTLSGSEAGSTKPADRHQLFGSPLPASSLWRTSDGEQKWQPCVVHGFDSVASAFWIEWAVTVGRNGRPGRVKRVPACNLRFGAMSAQPAVAKFQPIKLDIQPAEPAKHHAAGSPPATPPLDPAVAPERKVWRSPTVEAARKSIEQWMSPPPAPKAAHRNRARSHSRKLSG